MAFKPMLSQIQGGTQLRTDVDALQASYLAEKVITTIAKDKDNKYNADELLGVLKTGVDGVDNKITDALKTIQDKVVKDVVRVQLTATYNADNSAFTVALPEDFNTIVPQVDKTAPIFVYGTDGTSILGADGAQLTFNLEDLTFSGIPSDLDEANSTEDNLVYAPITKDFEFKIFPVGTFTLATLPETYMLDNSEFQMAAYDKVIDQVIVKLVKDKSLIDAISKLVGSQAVSEQIDAKVNAKAEELNSTITANKTDADNKITAANDNIAKIQGYVTETGLNANNKVISNVADGDITKADSKEAVNGGQLYAVKQDLEGFKRDTEDNINNVKSVDKIYIAKIDIQSDSDVAKTDFISTNGIKVGDIVIDNAGDTYTVESIADESIHVSNAISKIATPYAKQVDLDATNTKVTELETSIGKVKDKISVSNPVYRTQPVTLTADAQTEINLSATPNNSKVAVNINGLVYEEEDAFTVTRENPAKLVWTFTAANGGFDLKNDLADKITIHFFQDQTTDIDLKNA